MIVTCETWRTETAPPASSLGLDLWQSTPAVRWICGYLHAEPCVLHVRDEGREACLPVFLRSLGAGLKLASAYPYGWIAGDADLFWCARTAVCKALGKRGAVRLEIPFSGEMLESIPDQAASTIRPSLDAVRHVLDLENITLAEFERAFDPNIRWAARKALRNGVEIGIAAESDVPILQELYARTMRAKRAPVNYGRERWQGILSELTGAGFIYIARVAGRAIGMAATVDGLASRHLVQLAVPPEVQATRSGEFLVMTAIRDALHSGKKYFDFMASPASDAGLIAFKSKWGTRQEPIRHAVLSSIPLLSPAIEAARWLNRVGAHFRA